MNNQLFILVKTSRVPMVKLAERVGISRNTISQLISSDELPRNVKIETLDKIAAGLGYQVRVNFIPTKENGNILFCPDCDNHNIDYIGGDNYRCECGLHFAVNKEKE